MKRKNTVIYLFLLLLTGLSCAQAQEDPWQVKPAEDYLKGIFDQQAPSIDAYLKVIDSHCVNSVSQNTNRTMVQADLCSLNVMVKKWQRLKKQIESNPDIDLSSGSADDLFSLVFDYSRFVSPDSPQPVAMTMDFILLSNAIEFGFTLVRGYLKELYGPNKPFSLVYLPLWETNFSPTTRLSRYLRVADATECSYTRYSCEFIGNESFQDVVNVNLDLTNRVLLALKEIPENERGPITKQVMARVHIAEQVVALSETHLRPYEFLRRYDQGVLSLDATYSGWLELFEVYTETMSWFTNTGSETEAQALLGIYKIVETNRHIDLTNDDSFKNTLPMSELSELISNLKKAINEKESL